MAVKRFDRLHYHAWIMREDGNSRASSLRAAFKSRGHASKAGCYRSAERRYRRDLVLCIKPCTARCVDRGREQPR